MTNYSENITKMSFRIVGNALNRYWTKKQCATSTKPYKI